MTPGDGEPDPAAPGCDAILYTALEAATALAKHLGFRRDCVTAATAADQAEATAGLARAAEGVARLLELAQLTAASGRRGKQDLN